MTTRTTETMVVFTSAFVLEGVDGELPPGTYRIETEEEQIDSLSFVAYHRIATTITLPSVGAASPRRQVVTIDPLDLARAQDRDAGRLQATHLTDAPTS